MKLFGFQFVNSYSSLFYIAFFREVSDISELLVLYISFHCINLKCYRSFVYDAFFLRVFISYFHLGLDWNLYFFVTMFLIRFFLAFLLTIIQLLFDNDNNNNNFFLIQRTSTGVLNLGSEYSDSCGTDNDCMSLLSLQVGVLMVAKPMPKFFSDLILPLVISIRLFFKINKF